MNIRTHFNFAQPYHFINREERNYAAIFYHVLLTKDNLSKFLELIGCDHQIDEETFGVYFEYAFIRDIWDQTKATNEEKRRYILDSLNLTDRNRLEQLSVLDFNKHFGVALPSAQFIQSPSKWSITHYDSNINCNEELVKVSRFKWCFNAKPDIVIHTSGNTAICIEAKFESDEGTYPSNNKDKLVFNRRGISYIKQRDIQGMIMKDMLGVDVVMKYLVKNEIPGNDDVITWKQIFQHLDYSDSPDFIKSWIARLN